jgi:hypothetical protein
LRKVIFILLVVLVILGFTSCTKVTTGPDINGVWQLNGSASGIVVDTDMEIAQEGLLFNATAVSYNITDGAITTTGRIRFAIELKGKAYYFYGTISGDSMDGFVRIDYNGDVCGYWSATR